MIWIKLNDRTEHRWGIAFRLSDAEADLFGMAGWYRDEAERDEVFRRYDGAGIGTRIVLRRLLDELERVSSGERGRSAEDVRAEIERTCREGSR